jgi:hypothetical protein
MKTMGFLVLVSLLLLACNVDGGSGKNSFEGTWEFTRNEMHSYTFTGNKYEEYHELEGESGEHYHKGTFTYEEISSGYGFITFEQTHSAIENNGVWTSDEDTEKTSYEFINDTILNIGGGGSKGALYYRK